MLKRPVLLMTLLLCCAVVRLPVLAQDGGVPLGGPITVENAAQIWEVGALSGDSQPLNGVAFSPDGTRLVAGGSGTLPVRVWAMPERTPLTVPAFSGPVMRLAFSSDGSRLATGGGAADGMLRLWDARTLDFSAPLAELSGAASASSTAATASLAFSPDGSRLVAGSADGWLRVWDVSVTPPSLIRAARLAQGTAWSAAYSPDGAQLATGGSDGTIALWAVQDGDIGTDPVTVLTGQQAAVWALAYSPDGAQLASGGGDGTVRLWDPASGTQVAVLKGHEGVVADVAYSPDGGLIVSAGWDGTLRLWSAAGGDALCVLDAAEGQAVSAAFSPDGTLIASTGQDGMVRLWAVSDQNTDDALLAVVRENAAAFNAEDLPRYLATLDSSAPQYDLSEASLRMVFETYDLAVTIDSMQVIEHTSFEATVQVVQTTRNQNDQPFEDNQQTVVHTLRTVEGCWKIYESDVIDQVYFQ